MMFTVAAALLLVYTNLVYSTPPLPLQPKLKIIPGVHLVSRPSVIVYEKYLPLSFNIVLPKMLTHFAEASNCTASEFVCRLQKESLDLGYSLKENVLDQNPFVYNVCCISFYTILRNVLISTFSYSAVVLILT